MGVYTIEGIVLRRRNLREADRLVVVLTPDRGKLTVAARGARRPRSRLAGRLEPAMRFRALVAEGRTLDVISQVEVLDAHAPLRSDLERMGTAAVILELADRALAERHPHPDVYRLLGRALDLVDAGAGETAWVWFAARLLAATGHRPAVERCAVCGRRLRAPVVWSASQGGCLHAGCSAKDPQAVPVAQSAVALLTFLLDARPAAVARVAPAPRDLAAASEILRGYAEARWEVRLRAPGIVGRLRASTRVPAPAAVPPRTERRAPVV